MDMDELELGNGLSLRPATIEELERWLNPDLIQSVVISDPPIWRISHVDRPAVLHGRKTIVGRPATLDAGFPLPDFAGSTVAQVVSAIRLTMAHPISILFQVSESEGLMAFGGRGMNWSLMPTLGGPIANIDEEKAAEIVALLKVIKNSPNIERLMIPLWRWESLLTRPNLENKLIDAWVSLEALLQIDKELSFRASMRLAEFLGTSGEHKKDIYDKTKLSYDWRSAIVHGGKTKRLANRQSLEETVRLTTHSLREALLKVLALNNQFNPEELESRLLKRETSVP